MHRTLTLFKTKIASIAYSKNYIGFFLNLPFYKGLDITLQRSTEKVHTIFGFWTSWTIRGDHAGFKINLDILNITLEFDLYDSRHWNYERDTFYSPDEEQP